MAGDGSATAALSLNLVETWKESGGAVKTSVSAAATMTMTIASVRKLLTVYISLGSETFCSRKIVNLSCTLSATMYVEWLLLHLPSQ